MLSRGKVLYEKLNDYKKSNYSNPINNFSKEEIECIKS